MRAGERADRGEQGVEAGVLAGFGDAELVVTADGKCERDLDERLGMRGRQQAEALVGKGAGGGQQILSSGWIGVGFAAGRKYVAQDSLPATVAVGGRQRYLMDSGREVGGVNADDLTCVGLGRQAGDPQHRLVSGRAGG